MYEVATTSECSYFTFTNIKYKYRLKFNQTNAFVLYSNQWPNWFHRKMLKLLTGLTWEKNTDAK